MWILVYIIINGTTPTAINAMGPNHYFTSMQECFFYREELATTVGGVNGYYPTGSQAICVNVKGKET